MNNFTKKELEWLEEDVSYGIADNNQPEIAYAILNKIQAMISNCCECEHAWVYARDEPVGLDSCALHFFICVKCGEMYR